MSTIFFVFLFAAASAVDLSTVYSPEELSKMDKSILEDARLNFTQLATKYGYPVEMHEVQTKDGYILTLHRIPRGKNCKREQTRAPVLLMHGLFCSSDDYIVMGPGEGLGYILADECYDVWLGNSRGNSYSRRHVKMKAKDQKFWEFSWHEMGEFDLPAFIDYILAKTGEQRLHYIGHSQGSTQFFIFASLHPEYQSKVRSFHALSPVAFMKNLKSPTVRILSLFHKPLHELAKIVGLHEFQWTCNFLNLIGQEACKKEYPFLQVICKAALFLIAGTNPALVNTTMLPVIIGHTPSGAATRQLIHYAQGIEQDGFKYYDHGIIGNMIKYGSLFPPSYKIQKISIPSAFYYSDSDWLADVTDVDRLAEVLPNMIGKFRISNKLFSHVDFLWGVGVRTLVYEKLISLINRF